MQNIANDNFLQLKQSRAVILLTKPLNLDIKKAYEYL
jgi:hypothetical protein